MNLLRPFLAQNALPTDVLPGAWHWMGLTFREVLILFGAVAFVTLFLVIWAAYFRKKPSSRSTYRYPSDSDSHNPSSSSNGGGETDPGERRYRRKRRRRREHRPRNPTLAETGGLPPLRSNQPPDPLP